MRFEFPDIKRCCCCLPLRYGILIFGYSNLVFTILSIVMEVLLDWGNSDHMTSVSVSNYRGVTIFVQMWFIYILYILEIAFDIVLLIGAHTKRHRLILVYYYYGILTSVATFLTYATVQYMRGLLAWYWMKLEFCIAFSGFVIQIYLLLLIRTEMQKLKGQQRECNFKNPLTEVVLDPPSIY